MAAPPPPELIDDVAAEIFLRIPPDEPAHLVLASLVCKPWRRIITDRAFLRRYRAFHRTPPMLGFLHNVDSKKMIPSAPRFIATTAASPFSPPGPAIGSPNRWWAIDCRHGRVLINLFNPMELMVWDPITGDQHRFPPPPHPHPNFAGAVLCAARDCHHLDCHQGPFLVVFVGVRVLVGDWAVELTGIQCAPFLDRDVAQPPHPRHTLLQLHELSQIDPPCWGLDYTTLMTAEDGGLGFATVKDCRLLLWSRRNVDGIAEWEQFRVIELGMLIPMGDPSYSPDVVGVVEGTQTIFVSSDVGVFAIELKSGQVKKVGEARHYYALFPYMSFYTSDLARGRLAQPAGVQ
uniref:F-box domain-containing protein n=1 Tax=Oryza punctata TaxID=4537 RepID=A0A0E0LGF1_ORYPU